MSEIDHKHNKKVARYLSGQRGIEMTPDEVAVERRAALATIRQQLAARGFEFPEGEIEAINFIRALNGRPPLGPGGAP